MLETYTAYTQYSIEFVYAVVVFVFMYYLFSK